MDYDTNYVKVLLTDEELQFPLIDQLCSKVSEWIAMSKESKTRSANRRAELLYDELMSFNLPPIKINCSKQKLSPVHSANTSVDSDSCSSMSRPITRSLRSRSRTPTTTPCTPTHQKIRANMKQPASGGSNNNNQHQVSVSATKIRQQLRADSAQKKRLEEKERNERLMQDRKVKEVRAEAQKKHLLEERAVNAKLKREQRLLHAAEVRKAREEAKKQQKLKLQEQLRELQNDNTPSVKVAPPQKGKSQQSVNSHPPVQQETQQVPSQANEKLNDTFKKPPEDINNIDIVICDDSTVEQKEKVPVIANWARAPYLREALIKQYSEPYASILRKEVLGKVIKAAKLPVELEQILGSKNAVGSRHLVRTSSAVWSPPNRSLKRTSSMVMTPNNDATKR